MNEITKMRRWNPFAEFDDLQDRLRSLFFRSGDADFGELTERTEFRDWSPAVDVSEDDEEYVITADLPEVNKEDIKVTAEDGRLTIRGERSREKEEKEKTWHRVERSYGEYSRSFQLPEEVDSEKIEAAFENGVLSVHLPKTEEKEKKEENEIEVK